MQRYKFRINGIASGAIEDCPGATIEQRSGLFTLLWHKSTYNKLQQSTSFADRSKDRISKHCRQGRKAKKAMGTVRGLGR